MFIGASGKDLISFGSGQIDLPPPKNVFKAFKKFKEFRYGPIQGDLQLRTKIAMLLKKEYKHNAKPQDIIITNGASEALYLSLRCVMKPGDKILLTQPYYYSYPKLVEINDGESLYTSLKPNHSINLEDVKEKIKKVKAIIINSPSNPTGKVQTKKCLKALQEITEDAKRYLISDEAYSKLIYEGEHYSPKGEHVITINTCSKTYSLCGLRIGFAYCSINKIINELVQRKTHTSMNTDIVSQQIALEALKASKKYNKQMVQILKERRDLIYNGLIDLGFEIEKPEGAFYVFPKVKNPQKICFNLFKKKKIITYLGEWFGAKNHLRLSYCLDKKKIIEGLKRIENYLKQ